MTHASTDTMQPRAFVLVRDSDVTGRNGSGDEHATN